MNTEAFQRKYPIGSKWLYISRVYSPNAPRPGELIRHLADIRRPDKITHVVLKFPTGFPHVVTVNQIKTYYKRHDNQLPNQADPQGDQTA